VWIVGVSITVALLAIDVVSSIDEDRDINSVHARMKLALFSFLVGIGAKALKIVMHMIGL
jgi:hypothetical protein